MKRAIVRESFLSVLVLRKDSLANRDQQRINDNGINLFGRTGRKKIDMVAACGFHACHDSRESLQLEVIAFISSEKAGLIHSQRQRELYISLNIKTCGRKRIFGNINTDEQFTHSSASVKSYSDKAGEASGQSSMMTRVQRPNQPIMALGGREQTPLRFDDPGDMEFSCLSNFNGKTRLYKSYNTNSW